MSRRLDDVPRSRPPERRPAVDVTFTIDERPVGAVPPPGPAPAAAPREHGQGFGAVLRRRDFRLLWAAQAASQLADKFLMLALIVLVYDLSHRSTLQSLLMLAYTGPSVVLSAAAGVFADRHDKRALMIGTNLARGGLILLVPLAQVVPYLRHRAWPLLVVTLAFSCIGQVFAPAEAASIPFLVRRRQLMVATSLFMTTVIVTLVAGVPLASICIKLLGHYVPFFIAGALLGIAALCIWRMNTSLRAQGQAPRTDVLREMRDGLVILGRHPALRLALAQLALSLTVVFTLFALAPAYIHTVLRKDDTDTYLLLIPATLGMVAMALLLGHRSGRLSRARALLAGLAVGGCSLVAVGLVPDAIKSTGAGLALTPVAVGVSVVFGAALGLLMIPAFTVLQERTDEQTRGRIFGGIFTVINAAVALPLLLAGGLADAFGVDRVIAGLGVILLLVCAGAILAGRRVLGVLEG